MNVHKCNILITAKAEIKRPAEAKAAQEEKEKERHAKAMELLENEFTSFQNNAADGFENLLSAKHAHGARLHD